MTLIEAAPGKVLNLDRVVKIHYKAGVHILIDDSGCERTTIKGPEADEVWARLAPHIEVLPE